MGKSSPPPAPTPPSASEISAANTESARAMMKLQRAMQFGEEMMKDGYFRQKTDIPQGAEPVHAYQTVRSHAPESFTIRSWAGDHRIKVKSDGTVDVGELPDRYTNTEPWKDKIYKEYYQSLDGAHWHDFETGNTEEAQELLKEHNTWLKKSDLGKKHGQQSISNKIKSITGWKTTDGKVHTANVYYKVDKDGNRVDVDRDEAVETDFTGMGDTDLAKQQWEFEKETSPEKTQFLLDQMKQFGPEFVEQARDLVRRSDPTGDAARELLGKLAQEYESPDVPEGPAMEQFGEVAAAERLAAPPTLGEVAYTPEYERAGEQEALRRVGEAPQFSELDTYGPDLEQASAMNALQRLGEFGGMERAGDMGALERSAAMNQLERSQAAPSLERLEDIPEITADPTSLAGRRFAEQQFIDRAQEGRTSQIMADEARRVARGRAAATGNIFGGGAVIEESRAVRQAEDAGQRQALSDLIGFLSSGQTAGDYESRLAQQNLANRLTGIQQRTGAEQAEFGMGQTALGQRNVAALQERADQLGALSQRNQAEEREYQAALQSLQQRNLAGTTEYGFEAQRADQRNTSALQERADELASISQRNEAQQQEYQNLQSSLAQINQVRQQQLAADMQSAGFDNTAVMQERSDELAAMGQRNQAEESEYQNLLQGLQQQQNARTAGFGMQAQAVGQRNQAQEADFAREQSAIAQRNQARQQSFANAMQRTATQQQMQQQQMANLQSFSGLAPVSTQFGGLSGAQQQAAANFNPIQYQPTSAGALLQNQQSLQGNIFGTQAGIWGQQAQAAMQPSGIGSAFGTILGGFAGGYGEGLANK